MNAKQNLIFFIGLILIVMVFWVNGYWSILTKSIGAPTAGGSFVNPKDGKCPPGYTKVGNMCILPGVPPQNAAM